MARKSRKFEAAQARVDARLYALEDAVPLVQEIRFAKFDEAVEIALRLGVNPKHADQMVRGTVVLPHGLGRSKRVLVIAGPDKQKEAEEAGADTVGGDEIAERIQGGWMEFDAVVATPDMMRSVGKLGRILGPRGLMPNPRTGTVTADVGGAVRKAKAGQVQFRADRAGIVHGSVGTTGFEPWRVRENLQALIEDLKKAKPPSAKGQYVKKITLSTTMGPGLRIDEASLAEAAAE